jgi:hypothetical protein
MAKQIRTLTSTGQADPIKTYGGNYLLIVRPTPDSSPAATFGGTTITIQWRLNEDDSYITFQEDGASKEITEEYNSLVAIPGGEITATATGGSGFSVNFELVPRR